MRGFINANQEKRNILWGFINANLRKIRIIGINLSTH